MKINFITGAYPPLRCGIGDFVSRLAGEVARLGHVTQVITAKKAHSQDGPVDVRPIMDDWRPGRLGGLLKVLDREKPDIVNLHYPSQEFGRFSAVDGLPWLWRMRRLAPLALTIHEYSSFTRLGRFRIALMARSANHIIVPERQNLTQLASDWPRLAPRLTHIALGPTLEPAAIDPLDKADIRQEIGLTEQHVHLLTFGFVSPGKGFEYLLTAFDAIADRLPAVHLWLAADDQPAHPNYRAYHEAIRQQIEASAYRDRIHWTGYLTAEKLSQYLHLVDVVVLPYDDGASLRRTTLLNALAHGRPIISTGDLSPAAGVVVVPPQDASALAKAVDRLLANEVERHQLAEQAAQSAAVFDWTTIASQTINLFTSLGS
ncbi:MAG: glycosyltransferase [Ardenticatenaceae bacterium]|nr:glycosyltransferase [Ardenticatenaceae bacterium]